MNNKPIRIGFVGTGNMGQCAHLRNYATLPACQVVALAEMRTDLGQKVAQRWNIPGVYTDAHEMIKNEDLDALVCSQPFTRHGQLLPALLKSELPLFIEKPIAGSVAQAELILEALEKSKAFIMVGYHKRSDPATVWAKEQMQTFLDSNTIGKLRYLRMEMPAGDWISNGFFDLLKSEQQLEALQQDPPDQAMTDEHYAHYLEFVNYYIHQVNLVRHFLGDFEVKYADPTGVLLIGESHLGIPCTIEMNAFSTPGDWQEKLLIGFDNGWIELALPAPLVINRAGELTVFHKQADGLPVKESPCFPPIHAMRQQAKNFIAAVKGEQAPMCDAATAKKDLELAKHYIQLRYQPSTT